jgi:outer membrane receptor protein involved in Fe transport
MEWDTISKTNKTVILGGQLTKMNGEFSLEKLPLTGKLTFDIQALGYGKYERLVSFDIGKLRKAMRNKNSDDNSAADNMADAVEKDLGNIPLKPDAATLNAVVIDAPPMELKLDRRVFDVSKNITTTGGTAEDVLKNVPGVNVDIDGNVKLRNASPQIYVDGMPTTLTIDQIPADDIDKIEVITNPSAKFDAASGSGGIINIVMKQNREVGYNGTIRGGIDERGKINSGASLNVRQGKFNVFGNVFYHQVDHITYGQEQRDYTGGLPPLTDIFQHDTNKMDGNFLSLRGGVDYFINNRNTLTVSGSYGQSNFTTNDYLHNITDTLPSYNSTSYFKNSNSDRTFQNDGLKLSFKHLFPKQDEEFTVNGIYQQGESHNNGLYSTQYYDANGNTLGLPIDQNQQMTGTNSYIVGKADFTDPITPKSKIDAGVMATISSTTSINNNYLFDNTTEQYYLYNTGSSNFAFNQQIYAAYFIYSRDITSRISAQVGVRAENSYYEGTLVDSNKTFTNEFPFEVFPSGFLTYHLNEKSDLQLSYARHIIRPSFSQLIPFIDYTDSLNLKQGNPNLKPAFNNSFEINYLHSFDRRNMILASAYYKQTTGLISTIQQLEYNSVLDREVIINTYENANSGYSYGAEITSQNSISKWLDVTANVNLFESGINGQNLSPDLTNQLLSWFAKLNLTFKLPWNFTVQFNGNYLSKAVIPPGGSGGGRWGGYGGSGGGGGITPSAEGYVLPNYYLDGAIKKDFFKNKTLSITFNIHDIFGTAVSSTDMYTQFFNQTTERRRDPQFFRFVISYKFGKTDFSLFKRKDKDSNSDESPDQQEMQGGEGGQ